MVRRALHGGGLRSTRPVQTLGLPGPSALALGLAPPISRLDAATATHRTLLWVDRVSRTESSRSGDELSGVYGMSTLVMCAWA